VLALEAFAIPSHYYCASVIPREESALAFMEATIFLK
jgi:hypothetical protein